MNSEPCLSWILIRGNSPRHTLTKKLTMPSFTAPQSYIAFQWDAPNTDLKKTEKPWKDPEQDEVVIKVLACGVCGTYVLRDVVLSSLTN